MGRTEWDKRLTDIMSKNCNYFHLDEVLREEFYHAPKWRYFDSESIEIVSTISPTMYKGLDLILKTAKIMVEMGIKFHWNVIGVEKNSKFVRLFERHFGIVGENYRVTYCGVLSPSEIIKSFLSSLIYVHPSYIDNSPNSVCEAQIIGIPVIACYVGGIPSLVSNNLTGWLIPANAPYELVYLIKHFKDLSYKKISENEIKAASERHSRNHIVKNLLSIYEKCINT